MSQLRADNYANRLGTKSVPAQYVTDGTAKAWINFDGTGSTNRSSFNVSSRVNNGTGDHTVNLTNAMANANYSNVFGGRSTDTTIPFRIGFSVKSSKSASAVPVETGRINVGGSNTQENFPEVSLQLHGELA